MKVASIQIPHVITDIQAALSRAAQWFTALNGAKIKLGLQLTVFILLVLTHWCVLVIGWILEKTGQALQRWSGLVMAMILGTFV